MQSAAPVKSPQWIHKLSILLLHAESLAEHGGENGLREDGLLESALVRPRNLWEYEGSSDTAALASAYAFGILRNHPFLDGNDRAAFFAMGLFLRRNGYDLEADRVDAAKMIRRAADREASEAELAAWIRTHMVSADRENVE
ncbi:MAG TPA: type II toxin-antitoxin system death-on-curing family toxin [Candidatus Angelobacter sp.]|nr:type II toxin-antitoxin system death-on-curing family toxin [Candidatus Angelobacter sp.]